MKIILFFLFFLSLTPDFHGEKWVNPAVAWPHLSSTKPLPLPISSAVVDVCSAAGQTQLVGFAFSPTEKYALLGHDSHPQKSAFKRTDKWCSKLSASLHQLYQEPQQQTHSDAAVYSWATKQSPAMCPYMCPYLPYNCQCQCNTTKQVCHLSIHASFLWR